MTRRIGLNKKKSPKLTGLEAWDDILARGEHILWHGRPDGAIVIKAKNIIGALFGTAFAGFALFWMISASNSGGNFWMFGLLHFAVGIFIALPALFGGTFMRRHTWYTLTNKRAMIATDLPIKGKNLKTYPITKKNRLDFQEGTLATIYFAQETRRKKNRSYKIDIGFERILDGQEVYDKLRKIQGASL